MMVGTSFEWRSVTAFEVIGGQSEPQPTAVSQNPNPYPNPNPSPNQVRMAASHCILADGRAGGGEAEGGESAAVLEGPG
eukprot:scaffold55847_cov36-Phaeocystis_antarctica.AAC.1